MSFTPMTYGQFIWRVEKDQDRGNSVCKTRKMTAEEWKKYGQPTGIKRKSTTASVPHMKRQGKPTRERMSKEQLIIECRELGTDRAACKKIAEKYGYTKYSSVMVRIAKLGIEGILREERG